jgi:hypothetical protein
MSEWQPRHANCKGPQPPWMMRVRVGDVIRRFDGPFRIVREVTRYHNGELRSVTVVIRRCSWTGRCYTILNATDLRVLGYRPVRVKRRKLLSKMDRKIRRAIDEPCTQKSLTCCAVEGIS